MKKKDVKRERPNKSDDLSRINSEIGSFGLEPPKLYRADQKRPESRSSQPKKDAKRKRPQKSSKPQNNLTNEEKHSINTKKRKQMKKIRKVLSLGIIGILLIIAIVVALLAFGFKIDTIKVTNSKKYSTEQVLAVLPIEKENSLFFIDSKSASEKLEKNLPYIYDVEISRKLPSTIIVNVKEVEHIYYVKNSDKSYTYLDDNFKVIEANVKYKPKKGIQLKKLALSSSVLGDKAELTNKKLEANYNELMVAVREYKLNEITAVYSEGINSNFLVYDNRLTIKLGEINNLENKIFSALTAIEKLNDTNPSAEGIITSTGGKQVYFTENK